MKHFSSLPSLPRCPGYRTLFFREHWPAADSDCLRDGSGYSEGICDTTFAGYVPLTSYIPESRGLAAAKHPSGCRTAPQWRILQPRARRTNTNTPLECTASCSLKQIPGNGFVVNFRLQSTRKPLPQLQSGRWHKWAVKMVYCRSKGDGEREMKKHPHPVTLRLAY